MYDLVIVGAGPAGISASYNAKVKGLNYICLEKNKIASTINDLYPLGKHLFSMPYEIEIISGSFKNIKEEKPTREEYLDYLLNFVKNNKLNIRYPEEVEDVQKRDDFFEIKTDRDTYLANKVLLATGVQFCLRKLNVPGEDLQKVYYRLQDPSKFTKSKILVVGGGDSAIESALKLSQTQYSNEVILSYRKSEFFRIKENNMKEIKKAEHEGKLKILFNSNVKEILENEVILELSDKIEDISNDKVFIFIGSECNIDMIKKIGLDTENQKPIYNPVTYETSIKGIFAAGDLTKETLINSAVRHGRVIIEEGSWDRLKA